MRISSAGRRRLAAIVLAAGGSARLGSPKQLLRLRQEPLLARSCRLAAAVVDGPVIAVLGAGRQRLRSLLARRAAAVTVVANAGWQTGLAGSLAAGLGRLPQRTDGVLLLLVDQPGVGPADLRRLVRAWRRCPAWPAAAWYRERPGAPAVIPRRFVSALAGLAGDQGARALLRGLDRLTRVPMPAAACDIDTPADALALSRSAARQLP